METILQHKNKEWPKRIYGLIEGKDNRWKGTYLESYHEQIMEKLLGGSSSCIVV